MGAYIAKRLVATLPTLLLVTFAVFMMVRLVPGDPVRMMFPMSPPPPEQMELIRAELGLDRPALIQYASFMRSLFQGDLGKSYRTRQSVSEMIAERFPRTVWLTAFSMVVAVVLGVTLGVAAATKAGSWLDTGIMMVAVLGVSVPQFWLGMMLIVVFAVNLLWFPVAGSGGWEHLILPGFSLALPAAGVLARVTRASMLEVLGLDYIKTARAKGLAERVVVFRHALRNAQIPVLTIIGLQVGSFLTGTIVVENVFGYAGIGQLAVYALGTRDFPTIQAVVLLVACTYVLVNLVVDLAYAFADPRIRY